MFKIEVVERVKAIELGSGPDKGFVMTNLMNLVQGRNGCYSFLIDAMEDFHWKHAELKNQPEKICFFSCDSNVSLGIAISGTRTLGPEHTQQHCQISKAIREVFSKEYDNFSKENKITVDILLEDYEENGCEYSTFPMFNKKIYYDDGTTKAKEQSKTKEDTQLGKELEKFFKEEFKGKDFEDNNPFNIKINMAEGPVFNLNDLVIDNEGRRGRCMGYDPDTNKYQVLFIDAENISADGWYSSEQLSPYTLETEKKSEKVSSIDDLISRATAISEQSKGLADDLSKFKDGFEMTD